MKKKHTILHPLVIHRSAWKRLEMYGRMWLSITSQQCVFHTFFLWKVDFRDFCNIYSRFFNKKKRLYECMQWKKKWKKNNPPPKKKIFLSINLCWMYLVSCAQRRRTQSLGAKYKWKLQLSTYTNIGGGGR